MAKKTQITPKETQMEADVIFKELQPEDFIPVVNEEVKEPPLVVAPSPLEVLSQPPMNGIPEKIKEESLSTEEKVVGFLKARNTGGFIPINDFLKSIYGSGMPNSPKAWHDQRTMKLLRIMIERWVSEGVIVVENNSYQRLAKAYYPDTATGITHYYNLDTLPLRAKLP